jgi:hypothetical protein
MGASACTRAPQLPAAADLESGSCKVWYLPDEQDPTHGLLAEVTGASSKLIGRDDVEGPDMSDDGSVQFKGKDIAQYTKAGVLEMGDAHVEVEGRSKGQSTVSFAVSMNRTLTFHFNSACESREIALGSAGLLYWLEAVQTVRRRNEMGPKKK